MGSAFQGPQWMLEPIDSTKPHTYYVFSYTHIPIIKFNFSARYSKILTITKNKTIYCNKRYINVVSLKQL